LSFSLRWIKSGASPYESKVALLECGWPSPWPTGYGSDVARLSANDKTLADRCMEISGFRYNDPFSGYRQKLVCSDTWVAKYPACQPDAAIPTRSVERRLNSYYCTNYGKNTPECQPPGQEFIPQKSTPAERPVSNSEAYDYFEQNRFREQTNQLQIDMQNNSNHKMEKMLRDTAPKSRR